MNYSSMSEAATPDTPAATGMIEGVLDHAAELAKRLPTGVPDWVAAELTLGQLRLLFHLSRQGPMSMSGIGEWLGTGQPSVTGTIERLERHGLVERLHRTDDRRVVEAHLTDRGRELVADIQGLRLETVRRLLGLLEPGELAALDRLLTLIIERSGGSPS